MVAAPEPPQPRLHPLGAKVLVTPALGGSWLGEIVDQSYLDEDVARHIEVPSGYVLVRCTDYLSAPRLVVGHVYLVLTRFLPPRQG